MSGAESPENNVDVSVIIVNYNTADLLPRAIGALRDASIGLRVQTIIVDNASRDNSVTRIRNEFPDCTLIENQNNVGFGRANNQALPHATGRYVLLLNTDAFVSRDSLVKTVAYMEKAPDCGILGVRLTGPDGNIQASARFFPTPWTRFLARAGLTRWLGKSRQTEHHDGAPDSVRACDWVPGCYLLIRRSVINQIGLFDPRFFLYYEEVDLCLAAKNAGWSVICFYGTTVIHIGGESAKSDSEITTVGRQIDALQMESELLFFRKNGKLTGLFLTLLLNFLADVVIIVKRALKGKTPLGIAAGSKRTLLLWSLCWRTHLGTRPTR
jgi:N-acetylglucosaminyl-diphospho-decaprenol L-rhamnosyltransferase